MGAQEAGSSFSRHLAIWFFYHGNTWSGTASELLSELKAGAAPGLFKFESWPDTPNAVFDYLERYKEQLFAAGVEVRVQNPPNGLRMIGITWVDGIRRSPPQALPVDSRISTKQTHFQAGESDLSTMAKNGEVAPDEALSVDRLRFSGEELPSQQDNATSDRGEDKWDVIRNIPMRFRIDVQGGRRRMLTRIALIAIAIALALALVMWAMHRLRAASHLDAGGEIAILLTYSPSSIEARMLSSCRHARLSCHSNDATASHVPSCHT